MTGYLCHIEFATILVVLHVIFVTHATVFESTQILSKSWSNRFGNILTPVTNNVWAIERPFKWNSIDVGGKSVVIKFQSNDDLLVHSPVEATPELTQALRNIGNVKYIISPNYEHLKYANQWAELYPNAVMCACPGLPHRMSDIKWSVELTNNEQYAPWQSEFFYVHMDCEVNPFTSRPFFNEVVFFHIPTRTLFMADLYWNYPSSPLPNYFETIANNSGAASSDFAGQIPVPLGTRLWKLGMDRVYLPFYRRFMVGRPGTGIRREKFEQRVQQILDWRPELIVPCHGDVVRGEQLCRSVLTKHLLG